MCTLLHRFFRGAFFVGIGSFRCGLEEPTKSAKASQTSNGNENGTEIGGHNCTSFCSPGSSKSKRYCIKLPKLFAGGPNTSRLFYRHSGRGRHSVSKKSGAPDTGNREAAIFRDSQIAYFVRIGVLPRIKLCPGVV
jgi:hypothetical protein